MDLTHFFNLLLSTEVPRLPDLDVLRWARRLSWGLVLAGLGLMLMRQRWPRWVKLTWVVLVLVSVCLPGPWSPAFWLGLAFQSPSLVTTALFLGVTVHLLWPGLVPRPEPIQVQALWAWSLAAVVLGWVLMLDTFAWWPFSLYAFGFSSAALGVLTLLAVLPWVFLGPRHVWVAALLGGVLLLHVVLRLPTGNVWDALLDPWLWGVLHLHLVWGVFRMHITTAVKN